MKKYVARAALALAVSALLGCSSPARTFSPRFTHMDVTLTTRDRGKDPDTRLEFSIVSNEGGPAAAYLDIQGQALSPNSTVSEVVPASGDGFPLADLKHEQIMVKITPDGRSTWTYGYDVILHFSDGTEALLSSGEQRLSSNNTTALLPLSLATVASSSGVGKLERFGFKLLSKAAPTEAPSAPEESPAAASIASTQFTQMIVALTTEDKGKDAGTRLEFFIVPKEGEPAVGYLDVQGQALAPDSTVAEVVPSTGMGFTLGDLSREQIMVKITPGGIGQWNYKFDAVLHFANGSEAFLSSGDEILTSNKTQELIPFSLATVSSRRSHLGQVKSASRIPGTAPSDSSVGIPEGPPAPAPKYPKSFTHMDVTLTTRDRGKDPNTHLEFFIVPKEGEPAVGYLDVQGQALAPDSTVAEVVPSAGTGFTLDELKHEQIMVRITPGGGGVWKCKFDVILHFANGAEALLGSDDQVFTSNNRTMLIPLSAAILAPPNMIGGLEKFGFGFLKKIGR